MVLVVGPSFLSLCMYRILFLPERKRSEWGNRDWTSDCPLKLKSQRWATWPHVPSYKRELIIVLFTIVEVVSYRWLRKDDQFSHCISADGKRNTLKRRKHWRRCQLLLAFFYHACVWRECEPTGKDLRQLGWLKILGIFTFNDHRIDPRFIVNDACAFCFLLSLFCTRQNEYSHGLQEWLAIAIAKFLKYNWPELRLQLKRVLHSVLP